jgi:nitrile hydratase accessory protein
VKTNPPPLNALPSLPRDADGPVFEAPWQAHAFAMTLSLHEQGVFTWTEWAAALSEEIQFAQKAGDPDRGDTYYLHWLKALETLATRKGGPGGLRVTLLPRCNRARGDAPAVVLGQAQELGLGESPLADQPTEDRDELRVAVVIFRVELAPTLIQEMFNGPHVPRR